MPNIQANLVVSLTAFLQNLAPWVGQSGPNSEDFTLTNLDLTTWNQTYIGEFVLFSNVSFTGTLHGTTSVTAISNTDVLEVGQTVTGTNIPAGTTIVTINSSSAITLSAAATGSGSTSLVAQTAPTGLLATPATTTGGTLTAATYYYVVTALGIQGALNTTNAVETIVSNEVDAVISGSLNSVSLTWSPVTGATGYNVYRGSSSGGENVLVGQVLSINGGIPTAAYTDLGTISTSQSPPGSSPANYIEFSIQSFTNVAGESVTLTAALCLAVFPQPGPYSDPGAICSFAPGTSNGLSMLTATTPPIPVGGVGVWSDQATGNGVAVSSSHKTFRITNTGPGTLDCFVGVLGSTTAAG